MSYLHLTKFQYYCYIAFIIFSIIDTVTTSYGIFIQSFTEANPLLSQFSDNAYIFIPVLICLKLCQIIIFYIVIRLCNKYDKDDPLVMWRSAGNMGAIGMISVIPIWVILTIVLNWR